jgi:hypothetical protein
MRPEARRLRPPAFSVSHAENISRWEQRRAYIRAPPSAVQQLLHERARTQPLLAQTTPSATPPAHHRLTARMATALSSTRSLQVRTRSMPRSVHGGRCCAGRGNCIECSRPRARWPACAGDQTPLPASGFCAGDHFRGATVAYGGGVATVVVVFGPRRPPTALRRLQAPHPRGPSESAPRVRRRLAPGSWRAGATRPSATAGRWSPGSAPRTPLPPPPWPRPTSPCPPFPTPPTRRASGRSSPSTDPPSRCAGRQNRQQHLPRLADRAAKNAAAAARHSHGLDCTRTMRPAPLPAATARGCSMGAACCGDRVASPRPLADPPFPPFPSLALPQRIQGRLAMLGFASGVGAELGSQQPILEQLAGHWGSVGFFALLLLLGSLMPKFTSGGWRSGAVLRCSAAAAAAAGARILRRWSWGPVAAAACVLCRCRAGGQWQAGP